MSIQQFALGLVLAAMVFAVALNLRVDDFRRVAQSPRSILAGLIPQFILLPAGTWLTTLLLDLPPNIEVAMIMVATCPGAGSSNVVTHFARGNVALSVSLTAVTSLLSLLAMPFNIGWMVAANPVTAAWLTQLSVDTSGIWLSLLLILAVPISLGLLLAHQMPDLTVRIRKPLGRGAAAALLLLIVAGLVRERHLLTLGLLPILLLVVLHNASGLLLGWLTGTAMRMEKGDRRAITIEAGMQSSGMALGIIALEFDNDLSMMAFAGLWGIWHYVSALSLAYCWRRQDARGSTLAAAA